MDTEIELKLFVTGDVQSIIESQVVAKLKAKTQTSEFSLFNQYLDTPENDFRHYDIGFRIRSKNNFIEQTVKLKGSTVGGLHQRPEYNVQLDNHQPDLDLFDPAIWPDDLSLSRIQAQLSVLFTTDFVRKEYILTFDNGDVVELVYDTGEITAGNQKASINEIELELKHGQPSRLFEIAREIAAVMPTQIGNLSKAARGYMLLKGQNLQAKDMLDFIPVDADDSSEQGFCKAVEYALGYWQHHEMCFIQSRKVKDLKGMYNGLGVLLQAVALYLPTLQCESMLTIHRLLIEQVNRWYWLAQTLSLQELRSKRGPYRKKLRKHEELMSYLDGCSEGILQKYKPAEIIVSSENVSLQLKIAQMLWQKPWRGETENYTTSLSGHAKGWLSQGWHNVLQSMPKGKKMRADDYISQQSMLRFTLFKGTLLGHLFTDNREHFRAPWFDILDGIDELATLTQLTKRLQDSDISDKDELLVWCEDKLTNLLSVMERSRSVALDMEAYW